MEKYALYIIIAAALVLLFTLIAFFGKGKRKGRIGEKKTAAVLAKYSAKHKCKVINGIWLPLYNGVCEVDHIVFGEFGVAVIETKAVGGQISGSGKNLTHIMGKRVHKLYNPNLQNKTHVDNIRHHLLKSGFGDVPMFAFVVFTDENVIIDSPQIGMRLAELYDKLDRLPAKKCNYKEMYKAICDKRVRNPFKKLRHNAKH